MFIFFSLAIGLAAGVGMYTLAITSTLVIGLVILLTSKSNYAAINKKAYLLQLTYTDADPAGGDGHLSASHIDILKKHCKTHRLVNVRSSKEGEVLDLTYFVNLKNKNSSEALTRALSSSTNVSNVNLYFDEEQQ